MVSNYSILNGVTFIKEFTYFRSRTGLKPAKIWWQETNGSIHLHPIPALTLEEKCELSTIPFYMLANTSISLEMQAYELRIRISFEEIFLQTIASLDNVQNPGILHLLHPSQSEKSQLCSYCRGLDGHTYTRPCRSTSPPGWTWTQLFLRNDELTFFYCLDYLVCMN